MKKPELHDTQYWIDRPLTPDDKDWIDDQSDWIQSYINSTYHPHRQMIVDAVRELYPVNKILEVGCNTGSNLLRVNEMFPSAKLYGIDVNKKCIEEAKELLPKAILKVGTYFYLPFPDNHFDLVIADATLMYANPDDIDKAMSEINRVCNRAIIIVDRWNESIKGVRNGHVWARNYPTLLVDLGYSVFIKKIEAKDWPHSLGWQKFGYLFVGTRCK